MVEQLLLLPMMLMFFLYSGIRLYCLKSNFFKIGNMMVVYLGLRLDLL